MLPVLLINVKCSQLCLIAGDDGLEDPDLPSELTRPAAAIAGHASGPGGGAISAGKMPIVLSPHLEPQLLKMPST